MKSIIIASLIAALLLCIPIFGSTVGAQTPTPTATPTETPTPEGQEQEEVAPGPVRNLSAYQSDGGSVQIAWVAPELPLHGPGASHYYYRYRIANASWTSWTYTTTTYFVIRSLTDGQSYGAEVYACNRVGCGSTSSISGTYSAPSTPTPTVTPTASATPVPTKTATPVPTRQPTSDFVLETYIDAEKSDDDRYYGYQRRSFGDIGEDRFTYAGIRHRVNWIRWDKKREELDFKVRDCIKPSEFISLKIGSRTFTRSDIEEAEESDADCDADRTDGQEFEFDVSRNPLPESDGIDIELTLVGGGIAATSTPTPTPTASPTSTATPKPTATATPKPVAITGDFATIVKLMEDLHKAVAANATFKSADAKLTKCAPAIDAATSGAIVIPRTSLDSVLENYTAAFRTSLETNGTCEEDLIAALNTLHSVSKTELAKLKASNPEYAQLLNTPHGMDFEESVGDPDEILQYALVLASASEFAQARGQDAPISPPTPEPVARTGVNCLLPSESADTEQKKIDVLNCLVFDTPHDFWVRQAQKAHGPDEKNDLQKLSQYDFLGYEGWDCSSWFDGPAPSCLKHDVTWATLRKVVGGLEDDTLDIAWNPRNKYASDQQFFFDLKAYDCQESSILSLVSWCLVTSSTVQAGTMQFAVRYINDKSWVYTREETTHAESNPKYVLCSAPIPKATNFGVNKQESSVDVSWHIEQGCVPIAIKSYILSWRYIYTTPPAQDVATSESTSASATVTVPSDSSQVQQIILDAVYIEPLNRHSKLLGAKAYYQPVNLLVWSKGSSP